MTERKKKIYVVLGVLALLLGLYINFIALFLIVRGRGNTFEVVRFGIALVLFWMGYRAIRLAKSPDYVPKWRVTIWKVALGAVIIYEAIHSYYFPAPNLLKANNADEQQGMFVAMILLSLFGLWVSYKGFETKSATKNDQD